MHVNCWRTSYADLTHQIPNAEAEQCLLNKVSYGMTKDSMRHQLKAEPHKTGYAEENPVGHSIKQLKGIIEGAHI